MKHAFHPDAFAEYVAAAGAYEARLALLIEIRTEPAPREEPWPRRATKEDTRRI
jgi:hypothetical protein